MLSYMPGVHALRAWLCVIVGYDVGGIVLYASAPGDVRKPKNLSDTLAL